MTDESPASSSICHATRRPCKQQGKMPEHERMSWEVVKVRRGFLHELKVGRGAEG